MAVKDILEYYKECESQYDDMKNEMNDFRYLCSQGMVAPEIIENAQKMFNLMEDNYKKLSYVIFLLNKPVKKEKQKRYNNQNKKLLSKSITKDAVINQNKDCINKVRNLTENLK